MEAEGPDRPDLTIVDLPGLFHSDKQDEDVREKLVEEWLRDEVVEHNTIVLHVVQVN